MFASEKNLFIVASYPGFINVLISYPLSKEIDAPSLEQPT